VREAATLVGRELFGGPWHAVWPLVVIPAAAALAVRLTLKAIEDQEPQWGGKAAAVAAGIPGSIFLALATYRVAAFELFAMQSWACVIGLWAPPAAIGLIVLRAGVRLRRRAAQVESLLRFAAPASPRLTEAAAGVDVPVAELDVSRPLCVLAGALRPRILVSSGALRLLSDKELTAAIMHERAHARHRDTAWTAALSVIGDLALVSSGRALALFQQSRELIADREAIRRVPATDLASALVKFARHPFEVPHGASIAQPMDLTRRIAHLFDTSAPFPPGRRPRAIGLAVALTVIASFAAFPLVARQLTRILCSGC
jgi:Zn-dependent protease with chaperone function